MIEEDVPEVQDASNQTDTPICSEDDNTTHAISDVVGEAKPKEVKEEKDTKTEKLLLPAVPPSMELSHTHSPPSRSISPTIDPSVPEESSDIVEVTEETDNEPAPDISGLELLSNSIVEFESCRKSTERPMTPEKPIQSNEPTIKSPIDDSLGGLGLLCALAEQRIMEEVEVKQTTPCVSVRSAERCKKSKQKMRDPSREERKRERRKARKLLEESRKRLKRGKSCDKRTSPECDTNNQCFLDNDLMQREMCGSERFNKEKCSCKASNHRTYRSREAEEEVCTHVVQPILSLHLEVCVYGTNLDFNIPFGKHFPSIFNIF